MNTMILIISSILAVSIAAICWIMYRHFYRKKNDKIVFDKLEKKAAELNLEEVSLKALEKPKESLGKLVYAIKYFPESESLRVTVKSGHDLIKLNTGGTSDPYVKVWLKEKPKLKFETKVKRRTRNPVFNEDFTFAVSPEELPTQTLIFFFYDFDRFSKHEQIGCLMLDLGALDLSKLIEDWAELDQPSSDVNTEIPLGEICMSLKQDPDEEKLFVTILEAKGLRKHDEEDLYDPFLRLSLEEGGGIVIKKKFTTIKKATPNPYYNEDFEFQLSAELSTKVQLVVTAFNCSNNNIKHSMPIGNIVLGPTITGSGYKHWKEIISNPKRTIVRWHGLVEVVDNKK